MRASKLMLSVIEYRSINYDYDFPDTGHRVSINIAFCHERQHPTDPLRILGSNVQIVPLAGYKKSLRLFSSPKRQMVERGKVCI
jgi:hypothetical protein